ncbi:hypothetical protein PHA8399_03269 [Leisingera aquaemixtae]|uniref:Uncharacterized protein n=1 Tax=Leisingera aquaemixtae TaxID=1396826 RepID=A0A0P1HCD3_9RHOB|nr:hypothetical protein PHA8399_03269 [Leisingera aquaemixtae]
MKSAAKIRREKRNPCADFWHTLRVGGVCFIFLVVVLVIAPRAF